MHPDIPEKIQKERNKRCHEYDPTIINPCLPFRPKNTNVTHPIKPLNIYSF
ncbi:hypothetical protein D3OALGA1CA_5851 [Olavius algarvensis associated proteobacterium Delta 3]|nr:hypothetical protein D3OALGA1CA_5851 [Olavius algarvensis associated proteobacterium Delta 3]